ncbi:MAG: DUF5050 domain-containing protein [Syntrophomonadaceae bacterium]|nr:DUF5050 domain-containing protein [Syntrophomonadaceae bacterium]
MRSRAGIPVLAMVMIMMFWLLPGGTAEAAPGVQVVLPAFKVSLNGVVIENADNQYPLIVYKDITYLPLTYYDCRLLGLESAWNRNTGLAIVKTGVNWDYHKNKNSSRNNNIYSAQVASLKITVNGKEIDNSREEYPLLLFRNVTYLPLTWRFAVDEFGWKYAFDQKNGLVINSSAGSPAATQLILPLAERGIGEKGAFTMVGDYFYYEGADGRIYQAPVSNPSSRRLVYQLPLNGWGSGYALAALQTDNGRAILKYHTGGATMGSDHLVWLQEDGTVQEIDNGYSSLKIYDDYTVRVEHGFQPFANNLQIKKNRETEYMKVGDPAYTFGRFIADNGATRSAKSNYDLYLIGDEIYVLGYLDYYQNDNPFATTGIYRVNINTDATVRLCDQEADGFKIVNETIYFTDRNHYLYQVPLSGGQAELLVDQAVDLYEVFQGKVYYSLAGDKQLFTIGSGEPINPGGQLNKLEVQDGYLVAIFDKDRKSSYKMMVINNEGKVLYKTIENVLLVRIENGKIVFVKDN